jgi:hypothetical protein
MTRLAFYGWDSYYNTISEPATATSSKRSTDQLSNLVFVSHHGRLPIDHAVGYVGYVDKYHDLQVISKLRGRDRRVLGI